MKKLDFREKTELILVILLLASSIFSFIFTLFTNYTVGPKFYIGAGGLVIGFLLRFYSKTLGRYLIGLLILLGTFRLVQFSHIDYSFGFSHSTGLSIKINLILLIFLVLYVTSIGEDFSKLLGLKDNSSVDKEAVLEKNVKIYESQYSSKSDEELKEITDNPEKYTDAAVLAAKKLLENKNVL